MVPAASPAASLCVCKVHALMSRRWAVSAQPEPRFSAGPSVGPCAHIQWPTSSSPGLLTLEARTGFPRCPAAWQGPHGSHSIVPVSPPRKSLPGFLRLPEVLVHSDRQGGLVRAHLAIPKVQLFTFKNGSFRFSLPTPSPVSSLCVHKGAAGLCWRGSQSLPVGPGLFLPGCWEDWCRTFQNIHWAPAEGPRARCPWGRREQAENAREVAKARLKVFWPQILREWPRLKQSTWVCGARSPSPRWRGWDLQGQRWTVVSKASSPA